MFQYCVIVVLLLAAFPATRSQCVPDLSDPCSANCNGTRLSIKTALNYPIFVTNTKYNYTFGPCNGATCEYKTGTSNIAVCQDDPGAKSSYSLGKISEAVWNITSNNPLTFTIIYSGGDKGAGNSLRSSKITFTTGDNGFTYVDEDQSTSQYYFSVQAPAGSYTGGGGGGDIAGPIGLVLIFLAIAAFIAYFVIGGLVMYFVKGARGPEVIPNYGFWKDFPFLLKDAALFIVSPCYKKANYEKI